MPGRPLLYGGILILCLLLTSMPLRATSFVIGNSRLTFITDHLVRLEYALHQEFLNDSTLFAVVRGEYPVDVKHEQEGRKHVFSTRAMRLEFDNDGFPFGQNNLKVSFSMNGETKHWCLTDGQQGNLKGASYRIRARTSTATAPCNHARAATCRTSTSLFTVPTTRRL